MVRTLSYAELDHGIVLGACPRMPEDLTHLRADLGIRVVVNLQTDDDFRAMGIRWPLVWQLMIREGLEVTRVPIDDRDDRALSRHLDEAVLAVRAGIESARRVYLHCTAGVNRSPTVAIATLAGPCGMGLPAATEHVNARRSVAPAHGVVERWLKKRYPGLAER